MHYWCVFQQQNLLHTHCTCNVHAAVSTAEVRAWLCAMQRRHFFLVCLADMPNHAVPCRAVLCCALPCCAVPCCDVLGLQHLELEEVVNLAREVGGAHHGFLAIQTPINLKMNEAYTQKWQRVINKTATAAAEKAAKAAADAAAKAAAAAAAAARAAAKAAAEEAGTPLVDGSPPPPSTPPPPPLAHIVVHNKVSLADAAVDLGIQLFGSAPLNEVCQQLRPHVWS